MGTSWICSLLVKSVGDLGTPEVCLASEVGAVFWRTEFPPGVVCSNSRGLVSELDCSTPGGVRPVRVETESKLFCFSHSQSVSSQKAFCQKELKKKKCPKIKKWTYLSAFEKNHWLRAAQNSDLVTWWPPLEAQCHSCLLVISPNVTWG